MNIFEFKNSKLGMTLVEMVVSLVILGILMTSTMGMVISSNNIFISTSVAALDRQVGNSVYSLMSRILKYSTHLMIYNDEASASSTSYQYLALNMVDGSYDDSTKSGHLRYKAKDGTEIGSLYNTSFYGNRTIQYSVKKTDNSNKHIELIVRVFRNGKQVYQNSSKIKCVNLSLISIGANSNLIADNSSDESVNQFLVFDCDESFGLGGTDALSEEYRVNDFMNRYNSILYEYTSRLISLYGEYQGDGVTMTYKTPGTQLCVGGTSTATDRNDRISLGTFVDRTQRLYKIIFGTGDNCTNIKTDKGTAIKEESWTSSEYFKPVNTGSPVFDETNLYNCINLRGYYQNQMYDLLGFTPLLAAEDANWEEGSFAAVNAGTFYTKKDDGSWQSESLTYIMNNGDPLYGIVATKEELYLAYMLKYCNKNSDRTITKDEYPSFAENFFDSTSIAGYIDQTSTSSKKNEMVVMTYFKDNVADKYADLIKQDAALDSVYAYNGKTGSAYVSSIWYSTNNGPGYNHSRILDDSDPGFSLFGETRPSEGSLNANCHGADPNKVQTFFAVYNDSGTLGNWFYSVKVSAENNIGGMPAYKYEGYGSTHSHGGNKKGPEVVTLLVDTYSPTKLVEGTNCSVYYSDADQGTIYIYPTTDLVQGWYYYERNSMCYFFYLSASQDETSKANNTSNVAVKGNLLASKGVGAEKGYGRIVLGNTAFSSGGTDKSCFTGWAYAQAQYGVKDEGEPITIDTNYTTLVIHQFTDYALYAADWNSWFSGDPTTGILNKVINGAMKLVSTLFRRTVKADVNEIKPTNAYQSLGNKGKYDAQTFDGDIGSYNMAFAVFSTKRNSWYYVPTNTTRFSQLWSGLSITSNKDQPTALNVEFNSDSSWDNSTAMANDIDNRKMSAKGLLGVDTTSDILWQPLPVGAQTDVGTLSTNLSNLSISGLTVGDKDDEFVFNESTRNYSAKTTASSSTISCSAKDQNSTISIKANGSTVQNGGTINWASGENTVTITVATKTGKTNTVYVVKVTKS